jgi:NDP-sugar pyrophosphorylase family protein
VTRLAPGTPALDALRAIQASGGAGEVVDGGRRIGWVTDHALRRAHLAGTDLASTPVGELVVEERPAPAPVPLVVLQAGGRGSRLAPLTEKVPKPLLNVGRETILGRLLEGVRRAGAEDVWISVNHLADVIEERIGDGAAYGLRVRYLRESQPLGGAGPLALLPVRPNVPVLVLFADQITNLDFARMVEFHVAEGADLTIGAFVHQVAIPYGVLRVEGVELRAWDEKPTATFLCNGGFYVVSPSTLALVPGDRASAFDELVDAVQERGGRVAVFPILERWMDIGSPEELEHALLWTATGEED